MNRNILLVCIDFTLLVALVVPFSAWAASTENVVVLSNKDTFPIPQNNSTINFAYESSYLNANFENNAWLLQNLIVNNYTLSHIPMWCLAISAINSNVTISGYSPGTLTGLANTPAWLNYTVVGKGNQTINLDYGYAKGQKNLFIVYIDNMNRTQGDGWTASSDLFLTVSGAESNVSIYYPPNTPMPSIPPSPITPEETASIQEFPSFGILSLFLGTIMILIVMMFVCKKRKSK